MAESKIAKFKKVEIKMASNIKFSAIELVMFFCAKGGVQSWQVWVSLKENTKMAQSKMVKFKMAEFKIPAIIKLNGNEEFESDWISLSQHQGGVRVILSESERR